MARGPKYILLAALIAVCALGGLTRGDDEDVADGEDPVVHSAVIESCAG